MLRKCVPALLCSLASIASPVRAAEQTPPPSPPAATDNEAAAPAAITIPAGTAIILRVDQALSSQTARRGDKFPISLASDVFANNRVVIPAGTKGVGEVIHSAGKGFGGRAGELIITARYLEAVGGQIPLRGFKIGKAGSNNTAEALVATSAVPIAELFVTGS